MNFQRSLDYLDSFLDLEKIRLDNKNRDMNLDRMRFLMKVFKKPDASFLPVIIAGTKGKGSTGYFLEQILKKSSIPVGFYNSPHLISPRERIRVNGIQVSQKQWCQEVQNIKKTLSDHPLPNKLGKYTYFEITTLLAILIFKRHKISVGVFEVGLGGRLDATNVLEAKIAILTPIDYDHEAILGKTIKKIAQEKSGVIKKDADVVVACQPSEALQVIRKVSKLNHATVHRYSKLPMKQLPKDLPLFQRMNLACAVKASSLLKEKYKINISKDEISLINFRNWKGRLQKISSKPDILFDVGHNPAAIRTILASLKPKFAQYRRKIVLFSASADKNYGEMIELLSREFDELILTTPHHARSAKLSDMLVVANNKFSRTYVMEDLNAAWKFSKSILKKNELLLCTGSFFLIGKLQKISLKGK